MPSRDHLAEIRVGRGNHAHVDARGAIFADPLELALLQHAQQLHLQRRAHRPDLVEEQRALVRLLEPSLTIAHRAGERAAHVAEQLRFEQRFRHRAAIDRHEPLIAPRAVVVNRARHQLLARARFARDENRARRPRDDFQHLEQVAHHRAGADQAFEAVARFELRPQVRVLRAQPPLFEGGADYVLQLVELERLGDEIGGAALDRFHRVLHRPEAGHHDDHDLRIPIHRRFEHADAAHAGQAEVGQDEVEGEFGERGHGLFARLRLRDVEAMIGELLGDREAQRRLVFNQQDVGLRVHHSGRQDSDTPLDDTQSLTASRHHLIT